MKPPDFSKVVAANWKDTTAYLVAGHQPCIKIGKDELHFVKRRMVFVDLAMIRTIEPEESWFMGVIVCPGDDLVPLSKWAMDQEAERVHFYLHEDADTRLLVPWRDAGLPLIRVDHGFTSWRSLHKVLGWDLNVQVYDDHVSQ